MGIYGQGEEIDERCEEALLNSIAYINAITTKLQDLKDLLYAKDSPESKCLGRVLKKLRGATEQIYSETGGLAKVKEWEPEI